MSDCDFRLSKDVMPVRYQLRIAADLDQWLFDASERIELTVKRRAAEVLQHTGDLASGSVQAIPAGHKQRAPVSFNTEAEPATFRSPEPLPAGRAELQIEFGGVILERLRGFYRSMKDGAH